jgi:serine/threonine-protein kinase HipA
MKLVPGTPLAISLLTDTAVMPATVGRLAMSQGLTQLEWSAEALAARLPIDPLLYPLEPGLLAARTRDFDGLHGFLSDSLPDAWGTLLMQRRLARMGHTLASFSAVDRLALVGQQGRGALVYTPAMLAESDTGSLDLDLLAVEAEKILLGQEQSLSDTLATLGSASGGARPKVHVAFSSKGDACVGDADPMPGFESWIVKFRAPSDPADIGPMEEAYARMTRAAGITMASTRLIPADDGPGYFATRRFDRPAAGQRLHIVSLAGAVEASAHMPSLDYDGFLRATLAITRHAADVEQAFRRMVFNVLAHNRDDHTRQHAYLMDAQGNWRLAPAYDLTFSAGPGGEHYLSVEQEGRNPSRRHVESLGKRHGQSARQINAIIDEVRAALADWPRHAADTGVSASLQTITLSLAEMDRAFA